MDLLNHLKEARNWGGIIQQRSMDPLLKWVKTFEDVGMGWLYTACGIEVNLWQSERKLWATEKKKQNYTLKIYSLPDPWTCEYYLIWQKASIIFYGKNVMKLSWIIQVDPKCLYKCPYKRVRKQSVTDTQERRQCDPKGRDWSDVATSKRMTTATRSWKRPRMDSTQEPQQKMCSCW